MQTPHDNCLNIGRDDITAPALFTHLPRPARRSNDQYGYQCRFGSGKSAFALNRHEGNVYMGVTVYRDSEHDFAELQVSAKEEIGGGLNVELRLSADEMQALACALIDAAHHLRTVPAAPYVYPVADVKADAAAVPA
jgi:hypothetical protein